MSDLVETPEDKFSRNAAQKIWEAKPDENVRDLLFLSYLNDHCFLLPATLLVTIIEPRHEKTNVLISDLVRHKPGCTAAEDG